MAVGISNSRMFSIAMPSRCCTCECDRARWPWRCYVIQAGQHIETGLRLSARSPREAPERVVVRGDEDALAPSNARDDVVDPVPAARAGLSTERPSLRGLSAWRPRRHRESPSRTIRAAAAAAPRLLSADYPRGNRGGAATGLRGLSASRPRRRRESISTECPRLRPRRRRDASTQ